MVGLVGRNGIGKSTAVKILAVLLKPNLGRVVESDGPEATEKDVINYFKGTEARAYFENLHSGAITVAYKPQQVEQIPKSFQGNVGELLEKVNEKKVVAG